MVKEAVSTSETSSASNMTQLIDNSLFLLIR